jgi:hypothetical protein
MNHAIRILKWPLFFAYALAGAVALMLATPAGVAFLGQPSSALSFLPAKILGLPWSLPLFLVDEAPIVVLALVGICYGLNFGVALMLAREAE